jgi:hypothetical protein
MMPARFSGAKSPKSLQRHGKKGAGSCRNRRREKEPNTAGRRMEHDI